MSLDEPQPPALASIPVSLRVLDDAGRLADRLAGQLGAPSIRVTKSDYRRDAAGAPERKKGRA